MMSPKPVCVSGGPSPASQDCTPSIYLKAKRASLDPDGESPAASAARVLPWKVHTPPSSLEEDKENSNSINQNAAASGRTREDSAFKAFGGRSSQERKFSRQTKPETAPPAPPPTLEKNVPREGYLDKIASQVLRKTLNFAPPTDRNAVALNQVRQILAAEVQAQGGPESFDAEQMRKVPIVNEDLAAKLARRRGWEAAEEARRLAAQAAAQLLENEERQKEELAKQHNDEERAKNAERQAKDETALQRERELQIRKEIESQMEKSVEQKLEVACSRKEQRSGPAPDADEREDDEMKRLRAARKAAEAAAQLASLERQEIDRRINIRENEKSKLRQAREKLEDEVRKAADETGRSEQPLRKASGRRSSSDSLVPPLKLSKLLPREDELVKPSKPVLESFASMQAAASIATAAAAAAAAAHAEQPRSLKVDGKLSDILSGIDKLLRGEKIEHGSEQVPPAMLLQDRAEDAASEVQNCADLDKTREFWGAHDASVSVAKSAEDKMSMSGNQPDKSHALDRTDLVATPHHKLLLSNDLAFATPGTTSALVNDWCRSLQVKTRPVPREEVNTEEVAAPDPDELLPTKKEEEHLTLPSQEQDLQSILIPEMKTAEAAAQHQSAPVLLSRGGNGGSSGAPNGYNMLASANDPDVIDGEDSMRAHKRVLQLDTVYLKLENATQVALESAFNDKAHISELATSCTNLIEVISEYEQLKGQNFPETHSYIRLKNRLEQRIRAIREKEERAEAERQYHRQQNQILPRESSFKAWADLPFQMASSPRSPTFDTPRVGLRIAHKGSGHVVVVDLVPGTPADLCGQVFAGDIIEQADGENLMGMYISDVVAIISGGRQSAGTYLCLRLLRDSAARITIRIMRHDKMEIAPKPQAPLRESVPVPPFQLDAPASLPSSSPREFGPPVPPRPQNPSALAPPLPSRPSTGNMPRPAVPPLPSRPPNSQGALVAGNSRQIQATPSNSMSAWMNQPTFAPNQAQMQRISGPAPRLLPNGGNTMPRVHQQNGWFDGGLLGSINGMTQNILRGNVSTILNLGQNAQDRNHRRSRDDNGRGTAGLPYERYQRGRLGYERAPMLAYQPSMPVGSCPDSPGSLHHARNSQRRSSPPASARSAFFEAKDSYPDASSGMLM